MVSPTTPIVVGVGQWSERLTDKDYQALSPVGMAAKAAQVACEDAGLKNGAAIDAVYGIRQFENSVPGAFAPFGLSNNYPRSVAARIGANPKRAVLEIAGGQGPQKLVGEVSEAISAGRMEMALLVGSEAMSTMRHLVGEKKKAEWAETVEGDMENRGYGLKGLIDRYQRNHGLLGAPSSYALLEHARRGRMGMTRKNYGLDQMGRLFTRFSEVASRNPHSASHEAYSAEQLLTVTERNRMIADPYPRLLVARDQVNLAAAVIVTSVAKAQALGIPKDKWVFLHGYADMKQQSLLSRPDLSRAPAFKVSCDAALAAAGVTTDKIKFFDLYSCFPIAVLSVIDALGLSIDDPRGFTLTGGLPYFGGPGNNYSMHGIAEVVASVRKEPGSFGFVGANGGIVSKYSVGIYSTVPTEFKVCNSKPLQAAIDAQEAPATTYEADGTGRVETYTVVYEKGLPAYGVIIGRMDKDGSRFLAMTPDGDKDTVERMVAEDPLEQKVTVEAFGVGNRFAFEKARISKFHPKQKIGLQDKYEFFLTERRGHVLEITINRPDVRNCLHSPAHEELDQIFNSYLADDDLWVAILTGAGKDAFCAGNDLKYQGQGKPIYTPKSGFAGLTSRTDRNKPLICAVQGYAMGGGFEICLASDLVVADTTAQFALSEVKVGLVAGAGGIIRLPRQIPRKLALELLLTGRRISAQRAHELGVVNKVVEAGKALEGARELAAEILEGSPTSVRCVMEMLAETEHMSEMEAMLHRSEFVDDLILSEDAMEGLMAFAQKRKPKWSNR